MSIKRSADDYLQELLQTAHDSIPKDRITFTKDEADVAIRAAADDVDADVIVMGTLTRATLPGLLMGNTAESVLRQKHRSVMTLKPAKFQSPIAI